MADISLRFHKDPLVLSTPALSMLRDLGMQVDRDGELALLLEPEVFEEMYKLQCMCGVQCIVTETAGITRARLSHVRMENRAEAIAHAAIEVANLASPQHVLAQIGPCGLPLDASSKQSLLESRDQYSNAAKLFQGALDSDRADAIFLNGFRDATDLKCALMGVRKVSDATVFASVSVDSQGNLQGSRTGESLAQAIQVMVEYGAQVVGFEIPCSSPKLMPLTRTSRDLCDLPLLVQMRLDSGAPSAEQRIERLLAADLPSETTASVVDELEELAGIEDVDELAELDDADSGAIMGLQAIHEDAEELPNSNFGAESSESLELDAFADKAEALIASGAQFLRASGAATPAYAGALVAATYSSKSHEDENMTPSEPALHTDDIDGLAARLRKRVDEALGQ